jgi:hypothetical protein
MYESINNAGSIPKRFLLFFFFNIMTMENFFDFSVIQYQVVAHALTYGYAVMIAALFYFAFTYTTVLKKFRISSALSIVVMVSAFLILYHQYTSWT